MKNYNIINTFIGTSAGELVDVKKWQMGLKLELYARKINLLQKNTINCKAMNAYMAK